MFSRSRNNSKVNLVAEAASRGAPPPPPPPAAPNVWSADTAPHVTYYVRTPWEWVMRQIATPGMTPVNGPSELPSEQQLLAQRTESSGELNPTAMTPSSTRRRRNAARKFKGPATLKIEICNPATGLLEFAAHGTSAALDGMEDKDELVRTLQRCRCDHLNLSPPAVLISWDVSSEECANVVGQQLPALPENEEEKKYAVLKEPMGSQGKGIYFVASAEEIHKIIDEHRVRALKEPDLLDNLIAVKGRIPSWVLQAEVSPPLLIKDRRKFHIRSYMAILEKLDHPDLMDLYIFHRHEVRIAGLSIPEGSTERNRLSHITNGALSTETERVLLSEVEELAHRQLQQKTEAFIAETFGKHLLPDIVRRISVSSQEPDAAVANGLVRKFAVAGLDIMVTEDNRIYLLEVNANPAAPPLATLSESFRRHLEGFFRELVDLVVGRPAPNFVSAQEILARDNLI